MKNLLQGIWTGPKTTAAAALIGAAAVLTSSEIVPPEVKLGAGIVSAVLLVYGPRKKR